MHWQIRSAVTYVLHKCSLLSERAIVFYSQHRHTAASEIREENEFSRLVHSEKAGAGTACGQRVDES